ncbi:Hypothetical protein, putative [Bodo saltans]|uniref:Uncharacterized protein n=1 Tax=Bodo saltans TaxID=75058 RepID=A0A0S4IQ70_BODSA|nr:Hypothetical protein, putative [Bodo saltans]|eukprot:CUE59910.1 Hypothetical protein, putative [Bodo saltans]
MLFRSHIRMCLSTRQARQPPHPPQLPLSTTIPNLDMFVPATTHQLIMSTAGAPHASTTQLPPSLLRWNVRPRKGNTIVYCSRFLYRPDSPLAPPPLGGVGSPQLQGNMAETMASIGSNSRIADGGHHHEETNPSLMNSSTSSSSSASMRLDPTTRSVLRLKPFHVASLLVALCGGVTQPHHSAARKSEESLSTSNAAPVLCLDDEMFQLRVKCGPLTTPAHAIDGEGNGEITARTTCTALQCSGFVWRDGFVSCDRWGGSAEESRGDNDDLGAYPYPMLVIQDPAQLSALRLFLESALELSFGFRN